MAETYGIQLGVGFNFEEAKQNLNKMINDLQKDYKVNINFNNVNFDKIINDYKNLQQQLQSNGIKLNTDGFKQISQDLDKVSTKMKQVGDNFVPVKNVKEWSNGIGEVVKLTEKIDAKTGQVVSKYKEVSTNVRQVRDEESKLANLMANAREKSNVKQRQEELKTIQKQAQAINKNIELEYKLKQVKNTQANDTARKLAYQEEQNRLKNTTEIQKKIERIITGSNETIARQQTRLNRNNGQQYEQFWLKALKEKEQKAIEVENRIAQVEQKRIQKLGQEKGFASGGMFGNDSYIKAQIQAIYGADASIKSYKRTLDSAGNSQIKMTVATQQSNNQTKEFGVTIDRNTQKIYQNSEAIKVSNKHISNAFERMGNSIKQMASMALTMGLVYKGFAKVHDCINTLYSLDQQMVQVREISGLTQEQTDKLMQSYAKMSVSLSTTLTDMSKLSVELTRQGLAIADVNERVNIFSKFNKVINGDINQSTELMTAGINSMQVKAQELSDTLVKVSAVSGTSAVEVGQIIQKSGAMAKEGKVSLQELATMGAIISEKTRESGETIGTSLKTIFAKFQQVKKDTGEVNKDFSATINTLEKMGVETGSMAGQLKPVGEILQELANKWNDMNDKQKAMVSSSLGVYQISRFSALMQGLAKDVNGVSRSQQIYDEVMKASGETNKQYETYLNSLSGAIDKFKAQWEVVFNNSMNSSTLKSIVNMGIGILNLVDKFGGLNIALVSLGAVLLSSNNKFKSFKNSLFSIKATEDGLSHSILINGKSLQELKLAFTSASAGGGVFKGTLNMLKTGLTGLKLKAIGAKIAVEGLKMALTLGLSVAITFALEGIMKLINKSSELKQKNQELQQSVQQNIKSNNDMITYLRTEGKEYDNLSKKTKLTTEEQEKLKSIKQQLVDKFPELVKGINSETGEIELQKKSTKELIELLKQKNKLESNKLISGGNDFLKDKQKEYREIQKEIQKFQHQAEMLKNGGGNIDKTGANYRHTIDGLNEIKRTIGLTKVQQEELDRKTEEYKNILAQVGTKVEEQKQKYSELKPYVQAVFDSKNLDSFQQKLANIRIDPSKFLKDGKLDFTSLEVEIQKFKDSIEKDPNYSNIKMVVSLKDPKADDLKKYFNSILALSKTLKMSPLELTKIMPLSVNKEYLKKNSDLFVKILKDEIKRASGQDKVDLTQMLKGFDTKEVAKQNAQVAQSTYLLNQKQEDLNETYKNALNSAKDYNKYMKEMTENGHLSAESVGEINEKHSDLIPLLGDEKELYKHLESASKHERDVALNAISSKLEGNSTFCSKVIRDHQTAFDEIRNSYNLDLENFKTVATAKAEVDAQLCKAVQQHWIGIYSSMGQGIEALKSATTQEFLNMKAGDTDGTKFLEMQQAYKQVEGLNKGITIMENAINSAKNKIANTSLSKPNFGGIGGGGGRHSSGGGRGRHSSGGSGRHKSSSSGSHKSETQYAYDGKAENIYDATIKTINNSLEKSDKLIDTISQKIANLQSLESKSNFKDILTQENEKLDAQRVKLDKLKSAQSQAESMKEQLKQKFYSNWSWMKGRDLESMSENEWMSLYNKYYGQTLNFGTGDGAKKKEEAYKKGAELFKELKKNYEDASNLAIESADKELKLEQEINTAIKERIEIQTRMFDEEEERYSKRVSYSEYLKDVFNKTDEDRMKYTKQILEVNKDYQDNLYDHLNTIMAQRDSLERNTAEWNILNQQMGEYQQKLIDTSKSIEDQKQAIKDLEWDTQIKKYTELFNNLQDKIGDTHDKLEILMGTNSNDYTGRIKLMDEELTNSIEYNAQLRITNHQLQSQLSKLKKGTDEWTKVHDKIEEYNESIDASTKSILDQQKAIGNLQWETQLKRYTDVLDSKKNDIDDLQAKLDITNAKDRNDIGTRLALMESILSANKTYLQQTESLKNNLVKQRDELQVGSSEWEKINNKVKEYDNNIRNTSKTIAQHNSEILKLKWDFKIKQYTQLLNVRKDTMSDLQNELDIVNTKDEKNYLKKLAHMDKILQINNDLLKKNTSLRDELIEQRDELEKGSADWELINNKVKEYDNNINQATKSITQQNKAVEDLVKGRIRTLLEIQKENQERQLDKDIFQMPETEWNEYHQKKIERIKREIDETNEFVNKYGKNQYTDDELSAKNLELEQIEAETYGNIKNYQSVFEDIHNQRIQAIDDELKKLDEKNEKEKIAEEREKRRLDLEKLKIELENTRNQKNIQQLTKDDNGLYQFVYVADQKKVDDLEQQIKDKEEDNAKWEQDLTDQEYRKKLDKEKKFEDDMIKSKQAFHTKEHNKLQEHYQDMDRLVEAYLSELKEEYGNHYEKMLALLEVQIDKEKKIQENYQTVSFDLLKAYFYSIIQETQQNHKTEIEEKEKYYDKQIENLNKYCDDKIKKIDNQCKEEQDKLKEHHDNEANTISEHYKNLNSIVDVNMEDLKSIYSKKWDDILNILKDKVSKAEELNKQLQIQQVEAEKYSYEQAKKDLLKAKENNDEIEAQKIRDRYAKYGVDDSHSGGYSYDDAEDDFLRAKERGDEGSADEVRKKYNGSSSSHSSSHSSSDDDDDDSSSSHSSRPSVSSDDEDSFLDAKERGDEGDADRIREKYSSFDTGGYTGDWGDNGKLAILHEKELILNKSQTEDILNTVRLLQQYNPLNNIKTQGINLPNTSELKVHDKQPQIIKNEYKFEKAEFPNVTNDSGVQNLLDNLNRLSKQYSPN